MLRTASEEVELVKLKPHAHGDSGVVKKGLYMARNSKSFIGKVLEDMLEVVVDVRGRAEGIEQPRDASPRIPSSERHRSTDEDLSTLPTKELHDRLVVALVEIADIGEELARRSEQRGR